MKPVTTRTKLLTLLLLFAFLSSSLPALALSNASQTNLNSQGIKPQATATTSERYFYIKDHLGSTMMLTDSTGEPVLDLNYEAYGEHYEVSPTTNQAVADANNFLYTGQQLDRDIGQYYLRARFYDAGLGHFTVRDPIRTQAGINMYAYVNGNPINYVDYWGLDDIFVGNGSNNKKRLVPLDESKVRANFSHIKNSVGYRERFSLTNIISDLKETTDLFLIQSHHGGTGLWLEGGDLPLDDLIKKAGDDLPTITAVFGCNTSSCPSDFDQNGDKALLTFNRYLDVSEVSAFTGPFLSALGSGFSVERAKNIALSQLKRGNILERGAGKKLNGAIVIYGNKDAKIRLKGLR